MIKDGKKISDKVDYNFKENNYFIDNVDNYINKADIINYLQNNNKIYIMYFVVMLISTFIIYLIATLIDVFILSVFGLITAYFARIRIRYRAIFNMSVYALTLSIILKMLYITSSMFTNFEIKYFDFMYSAIGYIYLVASIFMIKSDIIKQQIELIKINKEQEQKEQEEQEEKEEDKEEESEEEKNNDKDEKEQKKKENNKEKEPEVNDDTENQGSQA